MRYWLIALTLFITSTSLPAAAVEVAIDASAGRDFVYATTDIEGAVAERPFRLGTGYSLVGDAGLLRAGWRALLAYRSDRVGAELRSDWAPAQQGRGWRSLAPMISLDLDVDDWSLSGSASAVIRSVDVGLDHDRRSSAVGQLQLDAQLEAEYAERIYLTVELSGAFYSVNLHSLAYRHADLGLLVTAAGHPESWLVAGRLGVKVVDWLRLTGGVGAVSYAATTDNAVLPKLEVRVGPFLGVTVVALGQLAVVLDRARTLLPTAGLAVQVTR